MTSYNLLTVEVMFEISGASIASGLARHFTKGGLDHALDHARGDFLPVVAGHEAHERVAMSLEVALRCTVFQGHQRVDEFKPHQLRQFLEVVALEQRLSASVRGCNHHETGVQGQRICDPFLGQHASEFIPAPNEHREHVLLRAAFEEDGTVVVAFPQKNTRGSDAPVRFLSTQRCNQFWDRLLAQHLVAVARTGRADACHHVSARPVHAVPRGTCGRVAIRWSARSHRASRRR